MDIDLDLEQELSAAGIAGAIIFGGLLALWFFNRRNRDRHAYIGEVCIDTIKIKLEGEKFQMELQEGQKVDVKVNFKTQRGNPATIEPGTGRWTSADESIATVTVDPSDETKASVEGIDGSANESVGVEFRADGDKGSGVKEIIVAGIVTVTQGDAFVGEMEFGTPVDVEGGEPTPTPTEPGTGEPGTGETPVEPGDPGTATGGPVDTGDSDV